MPPSVDIYLDDAVVESLTNVPFGTISDYLPIPASNHNVKVYATGTTSDPVIDANVTVASSASYTVAATGALGSITGQVLEDEPSASCDNAQVRAVRFSADAPAVDVATAGAAPADAVVKNLEYPNATDYLDLPGGTYNLEIRLAGKGSPAAPRCKHRGLPCLLGISPLDRRPRRPSVTTRSGPSWPWTRPRPRVLPERYRQSVHDPRQERGSSSAGIAPGTIGVIAIALASFAIASIASSRRLRQD